MHSSQRVTIRDVAAAAGVSHQTVSRVLNNRPDVSEETRSRVWEVIDQLSYRPSAIARSLSRQRSLTLGIVTAGLQLQGPSRTLNGILRRAEELGYTLLIKELTHFEESPVLPILNSLLERQVDGIVWAVPEVGRNREWLGETLEALPVPVVFVTMEPRPDLSIVHVDNYAGGRMATEHLLEAGHRHIGHITGPLDWWEARQRLAGWRDAMLAAGTPAEALRAVEGNWSSESGEKAIVRLLEENPETDAVFVANDQMALSVLQFACRKRIRIPQELAVVGFDGLPETAHYWPPLTTVYQDQPQLGQLAVEELVRAIDAGRQKQTAFKPRTITLRPELIVRRSSAAPQ